jgi:hypothetical protein
VKTKKKRDEKYGRSKHMKSTREEVKEKDMQRGKSEKNSKRDSIVDETRQ